MGQAAGKVPAACGKHSAACTCRLAASRGRLARGAWASCEWWRASFRHGCDDTSVFRQQWCWSWWATCWRGSGGWRGSWVRHSWNGDESCRRLLHLDARIHVSRSCTSRCLNLWKRPGCHRRPCWWWARFDERRGRGGAFGRVHGSIRGCAVCPSAAALTQAALLPWHICWPVQEATYNPHTKFTKQGDLICCCWHVQVACQVPRVGSQCALRRCVRRSRVSRFGCR